MNIRLSGAALSLVLVSGCATSPPPPLPSPAPVDAQTSARQKKIMDELEAGEVAPAKAEAQALAAEQPENREAAILLRETEEDAKALLGDINYEVATKEGDTFAGLAESYLNDRGLAYALARYNDMTLPAQPKAGQTIRIPGTPAQKPSERRAPAYRRDRPRGREPASMRPAGGKPRSEAPKTSPEKASAETSSPEKAGADETVKAAEPPKPVETPKPSEAPNPAPPPKPAPPPRDPAKAAALRSGALLQMNKGDVDRAVALLTQAAELDPDSAPIKADLERATRLQHAPR